MTLDEYFTKKPYGAKKQFAISIGITPTWLGLIISGKRPPSAALAKLIEKETKRKVTAKTLRPDL